MSTEHPNTMFLGAEGIPWMAFRAWNNSTVTIASGRNVVFWNKTFGGDHSKIWVKASSANETPPGVGATGYRVAGVALTTLTAAGAGYVAFAGLMTRVLSSVISFSPLQQGAAMKLSPTNPGRAIVTSGTGVGGGYIFAFAAQTNIGPAAANRRLFMVPWRV